MLIGAVILTILGKCMDRLFKDRLVLNILRPVGLSLGPVYMRPGPCQTGMKIEIVSMFT